MMIKKRAFTFIFCVLQLAFMSPTFAMQIQNAGQQQTQDQQQHQNSNTQSDSDDDNGGLHGLITDSPSDEQASPTGQTQDQSNDNDSDSNSQVDTQSDDDTQVHVCIYPPPHKGHDPCGYCGCPGNLGGIPCYAKVHGHTFELEKKFGNSGPCIICGKTAESK